MNDYGSAKALAKMLLPLSFDLNQEHYISEENHNERYCNKTALGLAVTESALSQGLPVKENIVILSLNQPGLNYCKIYLQEEFEIEVYQAYIPVTLVKKIRAKKSVKVYIIFNLLGTASELLNEGVTWLEIFLEPFNDAKRTIQHFPII